MLELHGRKKKTMRNEQKSGMNQNFLHTLLFSSFQNEREAKKKEKHNRWQHTKKSKKNARETHNEIVFALLDLMP